MLKFYILVSRNMEKVRRHWKHIPKDKLVFVINTLDKEFEKDCSQLLSIKQIEYHITESNGTPAKGKNELLKIFEKSDNDYCVQVDGDDFLTPYGVDLYQKVADSGAAPDSICLKHQIAKIPDPRNPGATIKDLFFAQRNPDWNKVKQDFIEIGKYSKEDATLMTKYNKEYFAKTAKYVHSGESHCRVVFFSKKAAAIKFPEHLKIGEDTLQYLLLKHEAHLGNLTMLVNDERPATYIYDQTGGDNILYQEIYINKNWKWMETFNKNLDEYEQKGILHEEDLPLLQIEYGNAEIDDLGFAGLAEFRANENTIVSAPANASQESILKLYKGEISIACKNNS